MRIVPRVVFSLPCLASEGEALVVAIDAHDNVIVQFALRDRRLRTYSEDRPPSITMPAAAAVDLAREIFRQLRPDLAAALGAAERRPNLRLVGLDDPGAA